MFIVSFSYTVYYITYRVSPIVLFLGLFVFLHWPVITKRFCNSLYVLSCFLMEFQVTAKQTFFIFARDVNRCLMDCSWTLVCLLWFIPEILDRGLHTRLARWSIFSHVTWPPIVHHCSLYGSGWHQWCWGSDQSLCTFMHLLIWVL